MPILKKIFLLFAFSLPFLYQNCGSFHTLSKPLTSQNEELQSEDKVPDASDNLSIGPFVHTRSYDPDLNSIETTGFLYVMSLKSFGSNFEKIKSDLSQVNGQVELFSEITYQVDTTINSTTYPVIFFSPNGKDYNFTGSFFGHFVDDQTQEEYLTYQGLRVAPPELLSLNTDIDIKLTLKAFCNSCPPNYSFEWGRATVKVLDVDAPVTSEVVGLDSFVRDLANAPLTNSNEYQVSLLITSYSKFLDFVRATYAQYIDEDQNSVLAKFKLVLKYPDRNVRLDIASSNIYLSNETSTDGWESVQDIGDVFELSRFNISSGLESPLVEDSKIRYHLEVDIENSIDPNTNVTKILGGGSLFVISKGAK